MSFTLKLDGIDLSSYVRVAPEDSMDPYGAPWQQPAFSEAAFAEGHPLLNVDAGNREMVFPLYVRGVASGGGTYSSTILALTPSLYWRLDDPSGTTATDTSGNGRNGTYSGATLAQAGLLTGDSDTCISLPGNDATSGVTSTFSPFIAGASQTFMGWCNRTNTATSDALFSGTGSNFPFLFAASGSQDVTFNTGPSVNQTWTAAMPTGSTVFWAMTYNDTSKIAELFINAVSQGTKTFGAGYSTPGNINMGLGNAVGSGFGGKMDEFATVPSVLSGAQILAVYNAGLGSFSGAVAAKDNLHAVVQQINNAIRNPASSPLRLEWKDSGASNSTFYDATFARLDPTFNYRLSEHSYADLHLHVWCAPPYGHTATERIIATAAGTAPGLTASLIGVASALTGDVAPQTRVTITTSGQPVGPAGRGVIVSAPQASGYIPFISAASFAGPHPSAALVGASGAPGSQALFRQPPDSGPIARFGLGATMYAGDKRIFAAVLPREYTPQGIWAADTLRQKIGPTAVTRRPDGFQLLDLGVVSVPTTTPTTEISLYCGPIPQTLNDTVYGKPPLAGADASSMFGVAGVYVLPERNLQTVIDTSAKPMTRSFFGASGGATASIDNLVGDFGETWRRLSGSGNVYWGASAAFLTTDNNFIAANTPAVRDFRMRAIWHPVFNLSFSDYCTAGVVSQDGVEEVAANVIRQNATHILVALLSNYPIGGASYVASMVIASAANFPTASTGNGLVIDMWRQDSTVTLNAQWANGTGIAYIPSAGMAATTVPVASVGYTNARIRGVGQPILRSVGSYPFSYAQFDELRNIPQPSEAYRITSVTGDTALRSPISGSGPNISLEGAKRGPALSLSASSVGVVAVDWQFDGGPMNDPLGVDVRVRERFTYAR